METETTFTTELMEAGLSADEALVYSALLKRGLTQASTLARQLPLSRPLIYKILADLEKRNLVEKIEKTGSVTRFAPGHPFKLRELVEKKAKDAERSKMLVESVITSLISEYTIATGKPGIEFYEGKDGIKAVLNDSLTSKTEILSYGDLEAIDTHIGDLNADYVAARERRNIKKRGIALDTPFAREFLKNYHKAVTTTKLIKADDAPFSTIMQIYDGKISYITLSNERMIGIIVADAHIYDMHRYLFESLWEKAEGVTF